MVALLVANLLLGFALGVRCRNAVHLRRLEVQLGDARRQIAEQDFRLIEAVSEARVDPLSNLPNRRAFDEKADELHTLYQRHEQRYALVMFDLDRFKELNDAHGHAAGDAVLAMIGRACRQTRRGTDQVARVGGEEFSLLMPHVGLSLARSAAERYLRQIESTCVEVGGCNLRVTASAGVAAILPGESFERLHARADEALYAAKQAGRNCVFVHDGKGVRADDAPGSVVEHVLALGRRLECTTALVPTGHRADAADFARN
jgi:diguanylate cyclase